MLISRKLLHKTANRLQHIMGLIDLDKKDQAKTAIHELADFLNSHVESTEDEKARSRREDSDD